jgi:hypothetical protein
MMVMDEVVKLKLAVPETGSGDTMKITKVRKGMGSAKYSTLITTIPSDMCKTMGIAAGDSLIWTMNPESKRLAVTKMEPILGDHAAIMYDLLEYLQNSNLPKGEKENIAKMKALLNEMGTSGLSKLPPDKRKKAIKEFIKDQKKKGSIKS